MTLAAGEGHPSRIGAFCPHIDIFDSPPLLAVPVAAESAAYRPVACRIAGPHAAAYLRMAKKGSPYSITERRVPELIPVLGSQPAGDVSH